MTVDNNALRSVNKSKQEMVLFKDNKIIPEKMYEFVCAEDYTYPLGGRVEFKAGVPVKINGLWGKQIVKYTRGKVQFVDKELLADIVADSNRDEEIANLKATVDALLAKEAVKAKAPEVEPVKAKPKGKAKSKKED